VVVDLRPAARRRQPVRVLPEQKRAAALDVDEAARGTPGDDLGAELDRIREFGVTVITQESPSYPKSLREIHAPPIVLYVWGELQERDHHAIGIIGARRTTHYGMESAKKLAYQLAYAGLTIVSGLARGIDTAAHQGAMRAKGRTIAVLGTGINVIFPTENKELFWLEGRNGEPVDCTRQRGEDHVPRQMLELRNDADRAVLAAIVESIVGIPAATTGAHLGKPRPHLSRSGMDGDGVRQRADRVRDQLIAGETSCRLIGDCFDRTRKTPEREHPDHQSSRTDS